MSFPMSSGVSSFWRASFVTTTIDPSLPISTRAISRPAARTAFVARVTFCCLKTLRIFLQPGRRDLARATTRIAPPGRATTAPRLRQDCAKTAPRLGEDLAKTASKPRLLAVLFALFGKPLDRSHLFAFGGREHDHALGRTAGDADAVDRAADRLSIRRA